MQGRWPQHPPGALSWVWNCFPPDVAQLAPVQTIGVQRPPGASWTGTKPAGGWRGCLRPEIRRKSKPSWTP